MRVWGQNRGRYCAIFTPNELDFPLGVFTSVPILVHENRSRNATVRALVDGQTDRQTD